MRSEWIQYLALNFLTLLSSSHSDKYNCHSIRISLGMNTSGSCFQPHTLGPRLCVSAFSLAVSWNRTRRSQDSRHDTCMYKVKDELFHKTEKKGGGASPNYIITYPLLELSLSYSSLICRTKSFTVWPFWKRINSKLKFEVKRREYPPHTPSRFHRVHTPCGN